MENDSGIELSRCDMHDFNLKVVSSGWKAVLHGTAESPTFCMAHRPDPNQIHQYPNKKGGLHGHGMV